MATFVLVHGAGSTAWDWHLVAPLLQAAGHEVVAVDLPSERADAELSDYVDTLAHAVGDRRDVIPVGHSLGGFTAPLLCDAVPSIGLVYLTAMIPQPGEPFEQWWSNSGHSREVISDDEDVTYYNGVPAHLVREARARARGQDGAWLSRPWPADRHPDVPTMAVACRDDGFFPAPFMRRLARDRLGIDAVEIAGGHYAALSNPEGVADALVAFAAGLAASPDARTGRFGDSDAAPSLSS